MRLTELNPFKVSFGGQVRQTGLVFRCPCCRLVWLSCKVIPATIYEQIKIFSGHGLIPLGNDSNVIMTYEDDIWHWFGEFPDMTVSPSIDAGLLGHWHGRIENGEIKHD